MYCHLEVFTSIEVNTPRLGAEDRLKEAAWELKKGTSISHTSMSWKRSRFSEQRRKALNKRKKERPSSAIAAYAELEEAFIEKKDKPETSTLTLLPPAADPVPTEAVSRPVETQQTTPADDDKKSSLQTSAPPDGTGGEPKELQRSIQNVFERLDSNNVDGDLVNKGRQELASIIGRRSSMSDMDIEVNIVQSYINTLETGATGNTVENNQQQQGMEEVHSMDTPEQRGNEMGYQAHQLPSQEESQHAHDTQENVEEIYDVDHLQSVDGLQQPESVQPPEAAIGGSGPHELEPQGINMDDRMLQIPEMDDVDINKMMPLPKRMINCPLLEQLTDIEEPITEDYIETNILNSYIEINAEAAKEETEHNNSEDPAAPSKENSGVEAGAESGVTSSKGGHRSISQDKAPSIISQDQAEEENSNIVKTIQTPGDLVDEITERSRHSSMNLVGRDEEDQLNSRGIDPALINQEESNEKEDAVEVIPTDGNDIRSKSGDSVMYQAVAEEVDNKQNQEDSPISSGLSAIEMGDLRIGYADAPLLVFADLNVDLDENIRKTEKLKTLAELSGMVKDKILRGVKKVQMKKLEDSGILEDEHSWVEAVQSLDKKLTAVGELYDTVFSNTKTDEMMPIVDKMLKNTHSSHN